MMLVKDMLKIKGGQIFSIGTDALLPQAVGLMVERDIGSPLVMENGALIGVLSFHDVAKAALRAVNFENKLLKKYIKDWPEQGGA